MHIIHALYIVNIVLQNWRYTSFRRYDIFGTLSLVTYGKWVMGKADRTAEKRLAIRRKDLMFILQNSSTTPCRIFVPPFSIALTQKLFVVHLGISLNVPPSWVSQYFSDTSPKSYTRKKRESTLHYLYLSPFPIYKYIKDIIIRIKGT